MWRRAWIWKRRQRSAVSGQRPVIYYIRWYDDEWHVRSESVGTNRTIAEQVRRRREQELNAGLLGTVRSVPLAKFAEEHVRLIARRVRPATLKEHRECLDRLRAFMGDETRLDAITPGRIEGYFAERLKRVKVPTANKDLRTMRGIFSRAKERGYVRTNPVQVKPVREPERELRVPTSDEVRRLIEAAPTLAWKALILLAVTTGRRLGVLCGLRWADVDFGLRNMGPSWGSMPARFRGCWGSRIFNYIFGVSLSPGNDVRRGWSS